MVAYRFKTLQQNVTMLHRMVQQLGTGRDTSELRNQCQHQLQVVDELRGKIQAQVRTQTGSSSIPGVLTWLISLCIHFSMLAGDLSLF